MTRGEVVQLCSCAWLNGTNCLSLSETLPLMKTLTITFLLAGILFSFTACKPGHNSELKPGYDKDELLHLLPAMERTYDSADLGGFKTPAPENISRVFRSSVSPFKNRFDIWLTTDRKAVIAIRGSIVDTGAMSFTAAFYCLMVPATGKIKLSDSFTFEYKLAGTQDAGVHLGCLMGLGFISRELLEQVSLRYKEGIRDFIILGHSQGSEIGYFATSYLRYLQDDGKLPADIRFKTYCIAAPKPGNLQYAYDYEKITMGGWAMSVNNILDWVPCIGFTLQSVEDFPKINPFNDPKAFLKSINYTPGKGFDEGLEQFSGLVPAINEQLTQVIHRDVCPRVIRANPGYAEPAVMKSFDYVRAGLNIPLFPDSSYYRLFPNNPATSQVWENHSVYPYYILVKSN